MTPRTRLVPLLFAFAFIALLPQLAWAHGMSEAEKLSIIEGGNLSFLWLGATHMLTGYDHLAFVLGIVFFLTSLKDVAKYVTAFTLGHSVTLISATFLSIQINYFAIDAVIGLSVSYIGFANVDGFRKYLKVTAPNMMFMIVGLGLIHGLGLSTRLQQLPLSEDSLLLNIISFNVGVELGQFSALAVMLILIAAWRKRDGFKRLSLVANYGLIVLGILFFAMQMAGFVAGEEDDHDAPVASVQPVAWSDTVTVTIPARRSKEYKFHVEQGATLQYAWKTDGAKLYFDFHAEKTGDKSGAFTSFEKATKAESSGSVVAAFTGTHGWYWKNTTDQPVTIEVKAGGDYRRLDVEVAPPPTEPSPASAPAPATAQPSPDQPAVDAGPPPAALPFTPQTKSEQKAGHGHSHDHGHSHGPVSKKTAGARATKVVAQLVKTKKLPDSWGKLRPDSVTKRDFKGRPEWVAVFFNDTVANEMEQRLYVFLTPDGEYLGANYTGR